MWPIIATTGSGCRLLNGIPNGLTTAKTPESGLQRYMACMGLCMVHSLFVRACLFMYALEAAVDYLSSLFIPHLFVFFNSVSFIISLGLFLSVFVLCWKRHSTSLFALMSSFDHGNHGLFSAAGILSFFPLFSPFLSFAFLFRLFLAFLRERHSFGEALHLILSFSIFLSSIDSTS